MKKGLDWYKHDSREFLDGVQGIGPDIIGAYIVLIDLAYLRGGETLRDDRHLAGILGCSKRKSSALTDKLIELGKLSFCGGKLTNPKIEKETKQSRNIHEARANGQRMRRENQVTMNKNNGLQDEFVSNACNVMLSYQEEDIYKGKDTKDAAYDFDGFSNVVEGPF